MDLVVFLMCLYVWSGLVSVCKCVLMCFGKMGDFFGNLCMLWLLECDKSNQDLHCSEDLFLCVSARLTVKIVMK